MDRPLFSHRQRASLPRNVEMIDEPTWVSVKELARQLISALIIWRKPVRTTVMVVGQSLRQMKTVFFHC